MQWGGGVLHAYRWSYSGVEGSHICMRVSGLCKEVSTGIWGPTSVWGEPTSVWGLASAWGARICAEGRRIRKGGPLHRCRVVAQSINTSATSFPGCPLPPGVPSLPHTPSPPPITPQDNQELTDVERAIETVINQFHCYAVKGQKEYLTPNEMRELVVQKLPHLGKVGTQLGDGGGVTGDPTSCHRSDGFSAPPQCVGPLDEKIECMGDPDEAKLEFGEYWDMMGDAAKGCRRK